MYRWIAALLLAGQVSLAQNPPQTAPPPQPPSQPQPTLQKQRVPTPTGVKEEIPPEEDSAVGEKQYSFNPLQAQKELQTGNYYFHKGSYRAAEGRFKEATLWNSGYDEAWLRLGEAEEKLRDKKAAKEAYEKYVELAADQKDEKEQKRVAEIRKKLEHLK
jgi:tetratricopeptide (TPR) repeat protein